MTDGADSPFRACAHCETRFQLDEDYPVVTHQEDGTISFFSFCNDDCRGAWEAETEIRASRHPSK